MGELHTLLRMLRDPHRWKPGYICSFSPVSCVIIAWHRFNVSKCHCGIKVRLGVALCTDLLSTRGNRKGQLGSCLFLLNVNAKHYQCGSELAVTVGLKEYNLSLICSAERVTDSPMYFT